MANVYQGDSGGGNGYNKTQTRLANNNKGRVAASSDEEARRRAEVEAEKKRKAQAQKDAEERAKQEAARKEAERRQAQKDAEEERKRQAQADKNDTSSNSNKTTTKTTTNNNKGTTTNSNKGGSSNNNKGDTHTTSNGTRVTVGVDQSRDPNKKANTKADTKADEPTDLQNTLDAYTDLIDQTIGNLDNTYSPDNIATINAIMPTLRSAKELADLYGLDYDYENIYNKLMKSVDAGYKVRYADQATAEDKYYDNAATAQGTLADTLQQQQSQAIMTGMNRGMQAANALSSILGVSQTFAQNAGQLAIDRGKLSQEYAAAQAKTGADALNTYNTMGQQLADVSKNLYSSDTSAYAAQLGYNADVNTANATVNAAAMGAKAQVQSALTNSLANVFNQYQSGQIDLQTAQIQANAAVKSAQVYGIDAATVNAASNEAIAQTSANAQIRSANIAASSNQAIARQNSADNRYTTNMNTQVANNSAVTGLVSGVADGTYTAQQGTSILNGYKAQGIISDNAYNSIYNLFNGGSAVPTAIPTATPTPVTTLPNYANDSNSRGRINASRR